MRKNRLKRFGLIINNISCMLIFVVAVMSLVSPGFFICHKDYSPGADSVGVHAEIISNDESVFGLESHIVYVNMGIADSGVDGSIANKVQQAEGVLVSVSQ